MSFINELKQRLSENLDTYYNDYYFPAIDDILAEFRDRNKGDKQTWTVVSFPRVKKIWEDYSRLGIVRDERGMDDIVQQIITNIARLQANTYLAGHESQNPNEDVENHGVDLQDFEDNFADFILDETGQWRLSDYGLDKLVKIADELLDAKTAEEKLLLVDKVFNVAHQRNDLPKLFIQGGTRSLNTLAGR